MQNSKKIDKHVPWVHSEDIVSLIGILLSFIVYKIYKINLPNQVPIHFNLLGKPDGYVNRNYFGWVVVIVPLIIGLILFIVDHVYSSGGGDKAIRAYSIRPLRNFIVLGLSGLSISLTVGAIFGEKIVLLGILILFLLIGIGIFLLKRRLLKASLLSQKQTNFKWLLLYLSPKDKRIFVEKKFGIGWTLNFGNPIVLLAVIIIIILFIYNHYFHF